MQLVALQLMLLLSVTALAAQEPTPGQPTPEKKSPPSGDLSADSPVTFPEKGALPAQFPPDVKTESWPTEPDYFLFSSPCRSVTQIDAIQAAMPTGSFTPPKPAWQHLPRTRELLFNGGELRILAVGDSIINDTMRSGWVAKLQQQYPRTNIKATVLVRGGGSCHHYREEKRVEKYILSTKPHLVLIGGISQKSIDDIRAVMEQIRAGLPTVEFLLLSGTFGSTDPRQADALAAAKHSGTGDYGKALAALAEEQQCAYLDMTTPWAEYILSSGLHPHRFYRDRVHANEFGEQILTKILLAFFAAPEISADKGKIGDLLRQWAAAGTAAGNLGDWYDNRDGAHSMLDLSRYPQLQLVPYSQDDQKQQRHWALQRRVLPKVVFGNSSTSATPQTAGSNGRQAYCSPGGLQLLAQQYRANNLYIYPEHRDYDPDTDPEGGYGDIFPTNSPYVLLSQGSSGSDQAFMHAVAVTLAAFQPAVKQRLIQKGLLMPTLQMVFRRSYKPVQSTEDYLTGKAHPTAFAGHLVDAARMVELAHEISLETIPPLVVLKPVEQEVVQAGRDHFDPFSSELLGATESTLAYIFRATTATRRVVVDAASSFDVNDRPIHFHWVRLRGREEQIQIKPLNDTGSRVEIVFHWCDREPIDADNPLASNRLEVGVFVDNGVYYSPPAFVTMFCPPCEGRAFGAGGSLLEVGYGLGTSQFKVRDWPAFFTCVTAATPEPMVTLLLEGLTAEQRAMIPSLQADYQSAVQAHEEAEQRNQSAKQTLNEAPADAKESLRKLADEAQRAVWDAAGKRDRVLEQELPAGGGRWRLFVERRLANLARDPRFYLDRLDTFASLPSKAATQLKRLIALGIIQSDAAASFTFRPVLDGEAPATERLTPWQRAQLERFHGELIAANLPGVEHEHRPYLTDYHLTMHKDWRDVYEYDTHGQRTGWIRYHATGAQRFTAHGYAVLTTDELGRCATAAPVRYLVGPGEGKQIAPWDWPPMRFVFEKTPVPYEYADANDTIGRPILPEKNPATEAENKQPE